MCEKQEEWIEAKKNESDNITTFGLTYVCLCSDICGYYMYTPVCVCVFVSYSEEVLELWAVVECRYANSE